MSESRNYLGPGAIANRRPARMARYWGATTNLPGAVAVVATINPRGWRAYIGACDAQGDYDQAAEQVASWGVKLSEEDARHFFPDIVEHYEEE